MTEQWYRTYRKGDDSTLPAGWYHSPPDGGAIPGGLGAAVAAYFGGRWSLADQLLDGERWACVTDALEHLPAPEED